MKKNKHNLFYCIFPLLVLFFLGFQIYFFSNEDTNLYPVEASKQTDSEDAQVAEVDSEPLIATASEQIKGDSISETPAQDDLQFVHLTVTLNKGESPAMALERTGIDSSIKYKIIDHLSEVVNFRQCMPGDSFSLTMSQSGDLIKCDFTKGPFETYTMEKGDKDNAIKVYRDSFSMERRIVKITGKIENSLFESFEKAGADDRMVLSYADIFASKLDFNSDLQLGDEFTLIYEKYYIANKFVGNGRIIAASFQGDAGSFEAFYFEGKDKYNGYFDASGNSLNSSFLKSPLQTYRITSKFTNRRFHPILHKYRPHHGVDLAAPIGTPVMAAAHGKVTFAGWKKGYGRTLVLRHNGGYETQYAHLSRFARGIKRGAHVNQKRIIGYVGSSGLSTGPHLDYRIKKMGRFVNPLKIKALPTTILAGKVKKAFISEIPEWKKALQETLQTEILMVEKKITDRPPDGWQG